MTPMTEALEKYRETRNLADTEVFGDPRTRPGHEMRRRQAQQELPMLTKEVAAQFKKVGFPVFVSGSNVDDFVRVATEINECVNVSFSRAIAPIVDAVEAALGQRNREFSPSAFSSMVREIRQVGAALGLTSIPALNYDGSVYLTGREETGQLVNSYIVKYLGVEFLAGMIEQAALEEAKNLKGDTPVIPVVVSGLSEDLYDSVGKGMFQGKFVTAEASADVSQEAVTKVFKTIRNTRKTKKEEQPQ